MKLATLGPKGTCSEAAAVSYLNQRNLSDVYEVTLFDSFESVIQNLISEKVNLAIIPCAYVHYNKLLFGNLGEIKIHEVMHEETPPFVLASTKDPASFNTEEEFIISSHPSPAPLIEKLPYKCRQTITKSNVISAKMVVEGSADFCITTTKAISVLEKESMQSVKFHILKTFGSADMIWIIFSKIQGNLV